MYCQHTPFSFIDRVWEPRYSTEDALIDLHTVKKAKVADLKIVFSKVQETSEWYGGWTITKKQAMKSPKTMNFGRECLAIPLNKLSRIELSERCEHDYA